MKKIVFLIALFAFGYPVIAQDVIIRKTGEEKKVIVKKVGEVTIEYVRFDNQNGPIYEVSKVDVSKIKYQNGTEDIFQQDQNNTGISTVSDQTKGEFIDTRDSTLYRYIIFGKQTWMAENLKYKLGRSPCNDDEYGCYYTFDEAMIACLSGWHLPTDGEWMELEMEAGMRESEANKLGWRGTSPGQAPALLRHGITGLDLNMCGYITQINYSEKKPKYSYYGQGEDGYYWTQTNMYSTDAYYRHLRNRASIERYFFEKTKRLPIRCVKD